MIQNHSSTRCRCRHGLSWVGIRKMGMGCYIHPFILPWDWHSVLWLHYATSRDILGARHKSWVCVFPHQIPHTSPPSATWFLDSTFSIIHQYPPSTLPHRVCPLLFPAQKESCALQMKNYRKSPQSFVGFYLWENKGKAKSFWCVFYFRIIFPSVWLPLLLPAMLPPAVFIHSPTSGATADDDDDNIIKIHVISLLR